MVRRISTGVRPLDRELGGGVREGSVVSLSCSPTDQAAALLHAFVRERPTTYITTLRAEEDVRSQLERTVPRGEYTIESVPTDRPIEATAKVIENVDEQRNVIVDPLDPLEETDNRSRYVKFMNHVRGQLSDTESIGVFRCLATADEPPMRRVSHAMCDSVWSLETSVSGRQLDNFLDITKLREGTLPGERVKLQLGETASVDTSRDIA